MLDASLLIINVDECPLEINCNAMVLFRTHHQNGAIYYTMSANNEEIHTQTDNCAPKDNVCKSVPMSDRDQNSGQERALRCAEQTSIMHLSEKHL